VKLTAYKTNLLFFGIFGVSVFLVVLMLNFQEPHVANTVAIVPNLCVLMLYYMFLIYFLRTIEFYGNSIRITYLSRFIFRYHTIQLDSIEQVIYTESEVGIGTLDIFLKKKLSMVISIGCIDNNDDEIKAFLDELFINGIKVTCCVYSEDLKNKFFPYTQKADQE